MTALRGRAPLVRRHAMTRTIQSQTLRRLGLLVRSEEHTSELQSQSNIVCRLLLEKKKKQIRVQKIRGSNHKTGFSAIVFGEDRFHVTPVICRYMFYAIFDPVCWLRVVIEAG